jgi:hypothetical protein
MIGPAGDHRVSHPQGVYESLDGVSELFVPADFEQLMHDLLESFRPDMLPKHIGDLARCSVR